MLKKIALVSLAVALGMALQPQSSRAQNFSLSGYEQPQLDDQIEPILQLFGALVGTGFVNTADLHSLAGFDIGARAVIAIVPDEYKGIIPAQPGQPPGPLAGTDYVPLPFLTASLGLLPNIEVMGRLFRFPIGEDPTRGAITLVGAGVKYGVLQLPALPKVMLVGAYHMLFVPEEFDFGTVKVASLKLFASQSLAIFTVYAGAGVDRTFLTVQIPDSPNFPGGFEQSFSGTHTHGTVGLTATIFPLVRVNADYNFGKFPSFSAGISVSLR
ncbi:MAG: hypothetical protein Q9P14_14820 [candidate division KSB1 bacterium]|nr:hypothetical protein [candidate division KSB1 bacterium]MDQ7066441.1 hypothetical protein [candidate division KSB1 bacterium]